jgi:glycosyltransferase involved in cell wall biosynthesis
MKMSVDDSVFDRIERIYWPKWRSFLSVFLALWSRKPLQVAYYRCPRFSIRATELLRKHDACIAHLIRTGDCISGVPGVKFLEMTDAISLNYERVSQNVSLTSLRALVYAIEARRLAPYERNIVKKFNHSFLVSNVDRDYLFKGQSEDLKCVTVVANGVDLSLLPYQYTTKGRDIVFIGNMFSMQNFDAALFLVRDVLPIIRETFPNQQVRIIGRIRPADLDVLMDYEGVRVTGEVSSISEAAKGAGVAVCPVRLGAGIQNKVLEYMSLGLPLVSTTLGFEGINARPGRELLLADDPSDMANSVVRLLNDRKFSEEIARSARCYVENNHAWDSVLKPFISQIESQLPPGSG